MERKLAKFVGDDPAARSPEQTAVAMISAARGYHRREDKPYWWGHFDRLNNPVDEWADNTNVFIVDSAEIDTEWHTPPKARKPQRWVRLHGSIATGELGREMYALYEPPSPAGLSDDTERRAFGSVTVTGCDDPAAPTEVLVVEREPKGGGLFDQLPFALTPGPPIATTALRDSIESTAACGRSGPASAAVQRRGRHPAATAATDSRRRAAPPRS